MEHARLAQATFSAIPAALEAFGRGEFLIVVDDEDRENEGDLVIAAQHASEQAIAFMVNQTSGVICAPLLPDRLEELRLDLMVTGNTEAHGTAFTISVDYRHGTTTGISAGDRALTIRALAQPNTTFSDFGRPGHVFPLRCAQGGVLKRAGHTEAAVDLARLAGLRPAAAICEITRPDGSLARLPDLRRFAADHGILMISIADLIRHRRRHEKLVTRVGEARMPTRYGIFQAVCFESMITGVQHLALVKGDPSSAVALVRVHSECLTGDALGSTRCDCGTQLAIALEQIAEDGCGVLVYLRGHEGRGIGLGHKLRAYDLQDQGLDTVEANESLGFPPDSRQYGIGAQILADLRVDRMRLMTNNPAKYVGLAGYGLTIDERVPLATHPTPENVRYLGAKQAKLGHLLDVEPAETKSL
jgi:3,4-dihydroxy 2-butanone 4-phosphate synthase/GTP cyclohydrolase II